MALCAATSVSAQPQPRRTTNVSALVAFPGYFHQRSVTVVGKLARNDAGRIVLAEAPALHVIYTGSLPEGDAEVRGEFWDLGRMNADDPRLTKYDLQRAFGINPDAGWPRSGQVVSLIVSSVAAAEAPRGTTIRTMVLYPSRYLDQKVTVTGQFTGRNLLGDLPDAPGRSPYDFVLRSADAAIWVTNLRPRGRDFELSLDTRVDTGRWIEVSGTLQQGRGLQWLNAEGSRIAMVSAPTQDPQAAAVDRAAPPPPPSPEVVFSAPVQDEADVAQNTTVRIQFSRDLDAATLKGRVNVRYLREEAQNLGEPDVPVAKFVYQYMPANRVLEIKFQEPLVRYRTIKVELTEGILGTDKQPLAPWTLSFLTGGAL
jgi:hypothetical protein